MRQLLLAFFIIGCALSAGYDHNFEVIWGCSYCIKISKIPFNTYSSISRVDITPNDMNCSLIDFLSEKAAFEFLIYLLSVHRVPEDRIVMQVVDIFQISEFIGIWPTHITYWKAQDFDKGIKLFCPAYAFSLGEEKLSKELRKRQSNAKLVAHGYLRNYQRYIMDTNKISEERINEYMIESNSANCARNDHNYENINEHYFCRDVADEVAKFVGTV
eukprot:804004_1